uniref:Major facilitator superfamily (MFS) profile domain-containing protein n=1 Tax=Strigamia maritima TaxID=126957 RepID=T1JKK8_STRMM
MEFNSDDSNLHKSSNDDTLTRSYSPNIMRRKSSESAMNGYVKELSPNLMGRQSSESAMNGYIKELSPNLMRRKSSESAMNGYIKELQIPISNEINNRSSSCESMRNHNSANVNHIKAKSDYGACKKLPSSGTRNTARLSTLGLAVGESLKHKKAEGAIQYLEQSVDEDYPKTIIHIKKDEQIDANVSDDRVWFKKFSKKQLLTLLSLCLVDFTSSMCMSIMAPFFPMEANAKGMDEAVIGFVFSNYALVMFLTSPLFGRTLPYFGAQFLFFSGLFLAAGCTVLFGVLDRMSGVMFTAFCFVVRSLEALGAAAFNTAACTIVAQIFPDNVSTVFGLLETFVGLGMTLGPAVGGLLYSTGGFGLPFYILGAFMLFMIPINMWLLPHEQTPINVSSSTSIFHLIKLPSVFIMMSVTVVQASAWSFLDPYLQPHLNDNFALSSQDVGLVFLMLSATYGIFCPVFGWVADRWGHTSIMMVMGMIITSASLLLIGPTDFLPFLPNDLWLNMVALILLGIATPLAEIPTFESMIDNAIDFGFEDNIGTYSLVSGLWSAAFSFGEFVGPSLGGVLVKGFTFTGASTGLAGLILIPAIMLIIYETVLKCSSKTREKLPVNSEKVLTASTEVTPLLKSLT